MSEPTNVFVQWKGTDVCLDFTCACGYGGHFDGSFAYMLRCIACGRVYQMPDRFVLVEVAADDGPAVQDTDAGDHPLREGADVVQLRETGDES